MNVDAVVFDMDGVLIDSEPFWFETERETFAQVGLDITAELYQQVMGLRTNEVVEHWAKHMPWHAQYPDVTNAKLESDIITGVIDKVRARGQMLPGVIESLELFRSLDVNVGLASSSFYVIIDAVIDSLGLRKYFDDVYSAQDEKLGKPDPGVYLRAATRLGAAPENCIAIEDSVNGVRAAKAAGYRCIAVPDQLAWAHTPERFDIADVIVSSLTDIDQALVEQLRHN